MISFKAHCTKGYKDNAGVLRQCDVTFEGERGAEEYTKHMTEFHEVTLKKIFGTLTPPRIASFKPDKPKPPPVRTALPPVGKRRDDYLEALEEENGQAT